MSNSDTYQPLPSGFVITIGRQFGCGARDIGHRIAETIGMEYYDKTLLSQAAAHMGFHKSIFDSADERRPSWLRSLLQLNYGSSSSMCDLPVLGPEGVYRMQSEVIKRLPETSDCLIVGRTADYLLRDHPGLISIFLHAPLEARIPNIIARGDAKGESEAAELARKYDRNRESYYSYYTNRKWGAAENYHLSIDTSVFSPDEITDIVTAHLMRKKKKSGINNI